MATDYGTDIDCATDLSITMGEVSGWRMLAQAAVRRLVTPRGSLREDPDYGYDLRSFVGSTSAPTAGAIVNELLKDERIEDSEANVARSGTDLEIRITMTAYEFGPFTFVLAIDQVSAELLLEGVS